MNRVREAREAKGWNRERLAVEAEVSFGTISNIERGDMPRLQVAQRIARALGQSVSELFPEDPAQAVV
jgi:transcriptional regulator with XRE-family HTH domain